MTTPRIGDAPIEEEYRAIMNDLARKLDKLFNGDAKGDDRKTGFVLMVFNFGEEGRCNYISNSLRTDIKVLLREQLARFEGQPEQKGEA